MSEDLTFITNEKGNKLSDRFNTLINNTRLFDCLVGYFYKSGFHQILIKEIFYEGPRNKILHGRNIYNNKKKEISRWRSTLLILTLWRLSDEF